jgi:hypothetical protein
MEKPVEVENYEPGRLGKYALRFMSENSFAYKIFFGPDPNKVRLKVLFLLSGLCILQVVIWVIAVIVYKPYPSMLGTGALAYTLGLRHAVDAGKISKTLSVADHGLQIIYPLLTTSHVNSSAITNIRYVWVSSFH